MNKNNDKIESIKLSHLNKIEEIKMKHSIEINFDNRICRERQRLQKLCGGTWDYQLSVSENSKEKNLL